MRKVDGLVRVNFAEQIVGGDGIVGELGCPKHFLGRRQIASILLKRDRAEGLGRHPIDHELQVDYFARPLRAYQISRRMSENRAAA